MMRVTYGVDTGGDEYADAYVNAAGVTDWSRVVSVRVSLLIKSNEDFVTDTPVPVTFVDGTVVNNGANADRRLRLVFSTTVGLRNRVP
jgi:type IV pilus assembly protein PilW